MPAEVPWVRDEEEALKRAERISKPVMVDFFKEG